MLRLHYTSYRCQWRVSQGLDDYKAKYAVDEVHYTEDMGRVLSELNPVTLHLLCGTNTDRCHLAHVLLEESES